jgi:transcription initiation factor TFIID subunit 5
VLFHSETTIDPKEIIDGYEQLRNWSQGSLDIYKNELVRVLWPMFTHCFLDLVKRGHRTAAQELYRRFHVDHLRLYGEDLAALSALSEPEHIMQDGVARKYLSHKVSIVMSEYSFELLVKFLHAQDLISMLSVLNAHLCVKVEQGEPSPFEDERDGTVVITGRTPEAQRKFNSLKCRWGLVDSCLEIERLRQHKKETKERERVLAAKVREEAKKSKKQKKR